MAELVPSILSADFSRLGEDVIKTEREGIRYLHIDVMDGVFVPSISFGFPIIRSLRPVSSHLFDVHLMVWQPIRYIEEFAHCGSDMITVHYEACEDLGETLHRIRECGCQCGVSVSPDTPVSVLYPYLSLVDLVLVMTVRPGFGGQKYMDSTTEKIRAAADYRRQNHLSYAIEIDGGVHADNIHVVLEAGADMIVCGSAVFSGDICANIDRLQKRIRDFEEKHGI